MLPDVVVFVGLPGGKAFRLIGFSFRIQWFRALGIWGLIGFSSRVYRGLGFRGLGV